MTGRLPTAMLVAFGGALGATARWTVVATDGPGGRFPWATLAVNVLGCLLVGLLAGAGRSLATFAGLGFAGGLTTFATLSVELADLLDHGDLVIAVAYVVVSLVAGVALAWLGSQIS